MLTEGRSKPLDYDIVELLGASPMTEPERGRSLPNDRRLRWVIATLLAASIVGTFAIAAYAIDFCVGASELIRSACEIRNDEDAHREMGKWGSSSRVETWTEVDDSDQGRNYYARVSNRRIARLRLFPLSELTVRVTFRDSTLFCVTVDSYSPVAPVVVQEWFGRTGSNLLWLSYLKAAVPIARVQLHSTLVEDQRKKAFAFRKRCLFVPQSCRTAEDVLPLVAELAHGGKAGNATR